MILWDVILIVNMVACVIIVIIVIYVIKHWDKYQEQYQERIAVQDEMFKIIQQRGCSGEAKGMICITDKEYIEVEKEALKNLNIH